MTEGFAIDSGILHRYTGTDEHVIFPEGITEIGESAFDGNYTLLSAVISHGTETVGNYAFNHCANLQSVKLPDSVKTIGSFAFAECGKLTSLTIPAGTEKIGAFAFQNCINLKTAVIPESVRKIGSEAFDNCGILTVICQEDSYAHHYCEENRIAFIFDFQFEAFHGLLPQGYEKLSSPFPADEEKPYIFISYSHRDREEVLKEITKLYESGWKIWYDEGLTIGDSYDEKLETQVRNSAAFLLFATRNSVNSMYIRDFEIPWAADSDVPVIKCIMDEDTNFVITECEPTAVIRPAEIETALEQVTGLERGEKRIAKGISVIVDPGERDGAKTEGYAYCLYADQNKTSARTIMLAAENSGCEIYDAVRDGEDNEKLHNSASLVVFLDHSFLANEKLKQILIDQYEEGKDIAVCQLGQFEDEELPEKLVQLHKKQWLNYVFGINEDMNTKLARHLQKRGCRKSAVLPGFEYDTDEDGIIIHRYTGLNPEVRIVSEYGGVPVSEIDEAAFINCVHLRKIVIEDGITCIGPSAFAGCTGLKEVHLPHGLMRIENNLFDYCASLETVTIPDSVSLIGKRAFRRCDSLKEIVIPSSVKIIDTEAFSECGSLSSLLISGDVLQNTDRTIRDHAFEYCTGLKTAEIQGGQWLIQDFAFANCSSLKEVILSENIEELGSNVFRQCTNLTSVRIPDHVLKIGRGLFSGCKSLKEAELPSEISELTETFSGCSSLVSFRIPEGVRVIGQFTFDACTELTSVSVPEGVEEIGIYAFSNCPSLQTLRLPESVAAIDPEAFAGSTSLCILCSEGSFAAQFCAEHGIAFKTSDDLQNGKEKDKGFFSRLFGHKQ